MRHCYTLALLMVLAPASARAAEETPEQLLPAGTQVYLRWDGIDAHRAAYDKTALGKMMKGDTGIFVTGVFGQIQDGLGALLTVEQLLGGVAPEKLVRLQADATEATKLLGVVGQNGFILAAEVRGLEPPAGQVTLILPNAGARPGPLFGALRLGAALTKVEVKQAKVEGRTVHHLNADALHLAWWVEGKHAVVNLSTDGPEAMVKRLQDRGQERLPANPLFKRVKAFDKFETGARAFLDGAALVKVAASRGKDVGKLLNNLGLDGLKSIVLYSGFDGDAERGLVEIDAPGPRKGLLGLFRGKPFTLADVPPLPPDVINWSMTNFDTTSLYDAGLQAAEDIVRLVSPDDLPQVKAVTQQVNDALGIDLRKDLLASLDDKFVQYTTPSEGPLTLGITVLFKVKDADKLKEALDQSVKALGKLSGVEVSVKKKTYRGVEVREVHVRQQGFIFVPTYTIHKGWLAVGAFPQNVHGYILRANGEVPAWKPSARTRASLQQLPKEFVAVSYSDPRPSLRQLLSIAPLIGGAVNAFNPESKFEVGTLPNAQEATHSLFPNVSVTSDDGKTLRTETRASLALPIELSGIDTYSFFLLFGFARFAF